MIPDEITLWGKEENCFSGVGYGMVFQLKRKRQPISAAKNQFDEIG
jgi:hypothetical protein